MTGEALPQSALLGKEDFEKSLRERSDGEFHFKAGASA